MDDLPGILRLAPRVGVPAAAVIWDQARSGGPGGQAVNTTNSKAVLRVPLVAIVGLSERSRERLAALAGDRLTTEGDLVLHGDETRSLRQNRDLVWERLCELVREALVVPKIRRATRPSRGAIQRRLDSKAHNATRKRDRRGGE